MFTISLNQVPRLSSNGALFIQQWVTPIAQFVSGRVWIRRTRMRIVSSLFFRKMAAQILAAHLLVVAVSAMITRNSSFQMVSHAINAHYSSSGLYQGGLKYINAPIYWWLQDQLKSVPVSVRTEVCAWTEHASAGPLITENFAKIKVRFCIFIIVLGQVSSNVIFYILFIIFLVGLIVGIYLYTKKIKEENARSVQNPYNEDRDPSKVVDERSGVPRT